jgi:hypothetical protein
MKQQARDQHRPNFFDRLRHSWRLRSGAETPSSMNKTISPSSNMLKTVIAVQ